ncbi:MAG: hypothetical protein ACOCRX_07485 [Candidatus Woesearchaeota archaeon]
MGISNNEVDKIIKTKFDELESAMNATEKELLAEEEGEKEFDKAKMAFHFGRVQQIYIQLRYYISKKGLLK